MSEYKNELGQPVGAPMPDWKGAKPVANTTLEGRFCRIVPVDAATQTEDLFEAYALDEDGGNWTYLPLPPVTEKQAFAQWMQDIERSKDPHFFAIIDKATNKPVGTASYLRIEPAMGVVEVGFIHFSPLMQKKPTATEAMYLMMKHAFDGLGYRRYEWKCDNQNGPSRRAAARLGFTYEGTFRQAIVYKGRNRDTAWFSIIDGEWPDLKQTFEAWLSPDNFDDDGQQKQSLESFRS